MSRHNNNKPSAATPNTNTKPATAPSKLPDAPAIPTGDPLLVAPPAVATITAASIGFVPDLAPWNEAEARRALQQIEPRLWNIPRERVIVARVDVEASARVALGAHAFATQVPGLDRWFSALHAAGLFDRKNLDDLRSVASVVILAARSAAIADQRTSAGKLSPELDQESARVEREMQAVCEYNLADHPVHGVTLEQLRPGTSYLDRAEDLLGYAAIYEAEHAELSTDKKWKASHVSDAQRLAGEIFISLGIRPSPAALRDREILYRAWTLLWKIYAEVQVAGQWMLRFDPEGASKFPSLISATRARRGTRAKQAAEGEVAPQGDGAEGAEGDGKAETEKAADAKPANGAKPADAPKAPANGSGAQKATPSVPPPAG